MLRKFLKDRSGSFAVMASLSLIPIMLAMGMAVDYVRLRNAQAHLQELADGAVLASAASRENTFDKLRDIAEKQYLANFSDKRSGAISVRNFTADDNSVKMTLQSSIPMMFMQIIGIRTADVSAVAAADRSIGNLEVALVLDNTFSMSDKDSSGGTKLDSLKSAALTLVDEVTKEGTDTVRIAVVPYSDYVNVGLANRKKSWISVPDDYSVEPKEKETCTTQTHTTTCKRRAPNYSCPKTVDGVEVPRTCTGACLEEEKTPLDPPKTTCKTNSPTYYKWYGCVGSRTEGTLRLSDITPTKPYPGYAETSQKCMTPIVPLTTKKADVVAAVKAMAFKVGSYEPLTYIPAGVVWGLNVLSPSQPFSEGAEYDARNRAPRKAMVLMTDGENTLRFRNTDGRHIAPNTNAAKGAAELATTNADTASICTNAKAQGIEIFSVAFMVDDANAKTLLEGCATDAEHYFDATDAKKLNESFEKIGQSLRVVRLTQ
ncbi:MAG: hypothetical protein DI629_16450 [Mesorhizobium amorphae]|nr:MAG: hypothetical protein DI629_16450 [Mesorhizobium amorphae]